MSEIDGRETAKGGRKEGQSVPRARFGKYSVALPESRALRLGIGAAFILGGSVGFLPILGFWMVPLGFLVLATDIPAVRRLNRRVGVGVKRWWTGNKRRPRSQST
jgi:hypothetical protein